MKTFINKTEAEQFSNNLLSFVENNNIDKLIEKHFPKFYNLDSKQVAVLMKTPSNKIDDSMYMELWNTCVQKLYLQNLTIS